MSSTNLPTISPANRSAKETAYAESYYDLRFPISGQQYDAVYTFFLGRTNNNKEAAASLASALLEVTYTTGVDPMTVLDDFKKYRDNENFKAALIGIFNGSRRNTSKIGYAATPAPNQMVARNLRT